MEYHDICLWKQRTDVWYRAKKKIEGEKEPTVLRTELTVDIHSNELVLETFLKEIAGVCDLGIL